MIPSMDGAALLLAFSLGVIVGAVGVLLWSPFWRFVAWLAAVLA
jgi:hypothetical protein